MQLPNWYRSYPAPQEIAEKNLELIPHVVDGLPKLLMTNYNYKDVAWPDDKPGFCMLEWDIALDPIARLAFSGIAMVEPRRVLVAPYRFHDTWVNWIGNDGGGPSLDSRPVIESDISTDSFGLGCIYIPTVVLNEFLVQMDHLGFTDYTFGKWYRDKYGPARLTWMVHPQHLHEYPLE